MIALTAMRTTNPSDPFALPAHGGDLAAAERRFGRPEQGWLDLSTGINPYSYPVPEMAGDVWRRLPGQGEEVELRQIAARAYGVEDPDQLVAVAGSQAGIQLLPRLRGYSQVAVVGPTYGEHAASWTNAGHQVIVCETLERIGDAEVVIVVNPNNPDGRRHDPLRLIELSQQLARRGGLLVVDEAFGEVAPELSLADKVRPGLVVLKSFGKFYGLAGVRLGFVVADLSLARLLRQQIGPWSISGPAIAIGKAALADRAWQDLNRQRLTAEAALLDNILALAKIQVIGGTSLFRLINASRAWALYEHLGQRGVLVRPFVASPRWLRIGLPDGDDGRRRLRDALSDWVD